MPAVQFGISSEERARGDLPQLPVINMFSEDAPTEEQGVILQSRPGLSDRGQNMGGGPVEALFKRDGVLDGQLFGISGGAVYRGTEVLGSISGSGAASMTGNEIGLLATAGTQAKFYDGSTLAAVSFPDGAPVIKVFTGASRFLAIAGDTGRFYFSDPLEEDFEGLEFATAESSPDRLLDGLFIDDTAVLFGAETVEFWPNTSDPDLPFQPLEGRVFEKGIRATGCAAVFNYSFAWVGNDNVVYVNGQQPSPISNQGLTQKIAASVSCRLFAFLIDGQEFLALRLDTQTYVFGNRNGKWSEFASYGQANWIPQCEAGGAFGSAVDGRTVEWSDDHLDFAGVLERRFRAGFPLNSGGVMVDNVGLRCEIGQTPYLTGDYAEPTVEFSQTRDLGKTFGSWRGRSLGPQGNYRKQVQWRSNGMASRPGWMGEFRLTAPVSWRVSQVLLNEPFAGGR